MWTFAFFVAVIVAFSSLAISEELGGPLPPEPAERNQGVQVPRAELDELFSRLAQAESDAEATAIYMQVQAKFQRSESEIARLLMARASTEVGAGRYPAALSILDKLVEVEPSWAEAWNRRATVRYLAGDFPGSMADIAETLTRESRHLGALSGMAMIEEESGHPEDALKIVERQLQIGPHLPEPRAREERLRKLVEGRGI